MKTKLHFQRFEFKYQMPLDIIEGIIPELLKYMEFDPYAIELEDHAYTVSSLYYDSVGLDCYYQKLAGIKTRKKIRIRIYNFDLKPHSQVFLEIKRKYDTVVVKDRLAMDYKNCYAILKNNSLCDLQLSEHDQNTLNEFLWLKLYNGMQPQVMVIYERRPLISRVDPNFRVTIDYNLRTYRANWLLASNYHSFVNPGGAVLEVKFNNILPAWFHSIIHKYNLVQRPFSKYCNSLEVCRPELAATNILNSYLPYMVSN